MAAFAKRFGGWIKKAPDAPGLERTFVGTRQTDSFISYGVRRATPFSG
jgi:hypothetical protein